MRLKSLELQGFKSFPDKTVISFDDGITAIVGPNGSGKSNISDGVRWVLGEQSTKTLRGSNMQDVIFAGTQKRGAVGFAEVSLTIDNSDGVLPCEYNEVTVTRRLYRSGESEYYINRSAVRLRDINEMFMDTGLGRDGYSIIGQGRIDEILSAKSGDRREIFEEASGISKFRHRKEESERKLASTEENLVRLRDILTEIESQVGPLKVQAEKAKQYIKIYDELRGLEVTVWTENLARAKENAQKYVNDYEVVCSQFSSAKAALDSLYNEVEELAEKMREKDVEASSVREEEREADREINEAQSNISALESTVANNVHNIERIRAEIDDETNRADGIAAQIKARADRVGELEAEIKGIEEALGSLKAAAELASGKSDDAVALLDDLRVRERICEDDIAKLKIAMSASDAEIAGFDARRADIEAELTTRENELSESKKKFAVVKEALEEAQEKCSGAENMLNGFEMKYKSRGERVEALRDKTTKLELSRESMENKLRMLRDMERDLQGYSFAVKNVMKAKENNSLGGIYGTVSQLIRVEEKYTVAIETILGGALQNIIVGDERDSKEAIAYLKRTDGGRATFMPLDTVKPSELDKKGLSDCPGFVGLASGLVRCDEKYTPAISYLLGRIAVCDNINSASAVAKKYGYSFRIVTLDGQIINTGGTYTGGSVNKTSGILTRTNEIKKLEGDLAGISGKIETANAEKLEAEREYNALMYEMEVCRADKRNAEDVLLRAETEIEHYKTLHGHLNELIDSLNDELTSLAAKKSQSIRICETTKECIAEKEAELEALRKEEEALVAGNSELAARKTALAEEMAQHQATLAANRAEAAEALRALEEIEKLSEAMAGDRAAKENTIREIEKENAELANEISSKKAECESLRENKKTIEKKITDIAQSRLSLEAERNRKDKESKDKNDEILKLERERSRLEMKKESAAREEQQITEKLWESYELTLGTAEKYIVEIESLSDATKRISELKSAVRKLGDVNVNAIEEYDRVSERYEFMTKQCGDLEKAKLELEKMIFEITEEMQAIFAEQFKVINKNFGETFAEIFGGGKAELVLEDESDILNCGIEIRVQPPGKTLKTITLLSGGERALVAIALYFAIMKIRPTPFCVLDEIEAALDDVNVARYAEYLRRLARTTQFIVITHRRGTMEEADTLYGVTMQEKGVSKMLAISISEVEKSVGVKLT
ncbi:MAG: chromosome segregation protein SMC [Oscillospiraceae bacterium]|nr:chromosome segregation protein SMC [Oscillospiraceae bacterium]